MCFKNTYAIVTGAASGIGRCYALQLAQMGYGIVLVDINGESAQELSEQIKQQHNVPAPVICIDLTQSDAADQVFDNCRESGYHVEILINNAGFLITSLIEDTDPQKLQQIIALHCTTPLLLCRLFIPLMKEQSRGYILNISSISAWMEWPVIGMYGTTKRFVKGYSHQLHIECKCSPVSVTTAIFGAVDTPLIRFPLMMRYRRILLRLGLLISPEKAAHFALKAMFRRKAKLIPSFLDRLVIIICPWVTDWLLSFLIRKTDLKSAF